MSAKAKSGIVVSGRPGGRIGVHGRLAILIGGAVVLLAIVAGATYAVVRHATKASNSSSSAAKSDKYPGAKTPVDKAYAYENGGDYDKAQQIIQDSIKPGASKSDQAQAYLTQASLALNAGKYADAKTYAVKADQLDPTDVSAAMIGDIAMKLNDKATAQKEYNLALQRLDKMLPSYPQRLNAYQKDLEAAKS